jgi:hypothetical protein
MGVAIDTVLCDVNNPGATFSACAVAAGNTDSLTVRNFPGMNKAVLVDIIRRHATAGAVRVTSPLMHDNVTGLTFYTSENPLLATLPNYFGQPVQPGDTLGVSATGASNAHCSVGLVLHYDNLTGAAANLWSLNEIQNSVKSLKYCTVAVTASGTVGLWADTLVTATENQLHATSFYAVMGYGSDTALGCIGFKSQATANLRVCGPGTTNFEDSSEYFANKSFDWNIPYIPVFNGQDRGACYVSVSDNAASTTANVTLCLAELVGQNWSH